jgi:hypothetical protein
LEVPLRPHQSEPSPEALAAIEVEWPLIAAELDVLNAEIANIYAADHGGPSPLDWRRLRRAEARVTRVAAELARTVTTPVARSAGTAVA